MSDVRLAELAAGPSCKKLVLALALRVVFWWLPPPLFFLPRSPFWWGGLAFRSALPRGGRPGFAQFTVLWPARAHEPVVQAHRRQLVDKQQATAVLRTCQTNHSIPAFALELVAATVAAWTRTRGPNTPDLELVLAKPLAKPVAKPVAGCSCSG